MIQITASLRKYFREISKLGFPRVWWYDRALNLRNNRLSGLVEMCLTILLQTIKRNSKSIKSINNLRLIRFSTRLDLFITSILVTVSGFPRRQAVHTSEKRRSTCRAYRNKFQTDVLSVLTKVFFVIICPDIRDKPHWNRIDNVYLMVDEILRL